MSRISLLALSLFLLWSLPSPAPAEAARKRAVETSSASEVLRDFERILDLWRDGNYAALFERTYGGRDSAEQFARRLSSVPRRPACCWEKMQDAQVSMKGARAAAVRVRLGFDGNVSGTEFVTRSIKLRRDDGFWTISQSDLYSLANVGKRRYRYKYLPMQGK